MKTLDVLILISKALEPNILDGSLKQMDYDSQDERLTITTVDGDKFIVALIRLSLGQR